MHVLIQLNMQFYLCLILGHEGGQESVDLLRIGIDEVNGVTNDLAESMGDLGTSEGLGASQSVGLVEVRVRVEEYFSGGNTDVLDGDRAVSTAAERLGKESLSNAVFLAKVVFLKDQIR